MSSGGFGFPQSKKNNPSLTQMMKAIRSFETSVASYPTTQRRVLELLNLMPLPLPCTSFQFYIRAATWQYKLCSCIIIVVSTETRDLETPVLLLDLPKYNFTLIRHSKVIEKNTPVVVTTPFIHVTFNSKFMHACFCSCFCWWWWWWRSIIRSFYLLLCNMSLILPTGIVFKTSLQLL